MKEWYDLTKPTSGALMAEFICGTCGELFSRSKRVTHLCRTESESTYCSSVCSGKRIKPSEFIREFRTSKERSLDWKVDSKLGYVYALHSLHPNADKNGKLYQHHYVMSKHTGSPIETGYVVHHKDRDRANNDISNLQLMTSHDHIMLHVIEDRKYTSSDIDCLHCGKTMNVSDRSTKKYCSSECQNQDRRKFNTSAEELVELLWRHPMTTLSKLLGVSDVAISKRAKLLGVEKPPRGYWNNKKG